ncbi:MAG: Phenylalanine--tRNA ligase beta subunit [Patescibacteria group bacterium]|jgi:phenylalanyl-tRNA synthetase beta chain|nr:Phenylalanine--tRNA ligase beta subunit [Patescibacteria group bacterium]
MKLSYNWLKWYIPEIPTPEKLSDVFTYHLCEVDGVETHIGKDGTEDTIFDLNILPNRAHDLLSHHGVARELSGLLNIAFNDPTPKYKIPESSETNLQITIESENCRRYSARVIHDVKVGASPDWVTAHLESIGQKSINNVVDATNITMYDCGQPTHAFDASKVKGSISIRNAKAGETMTTLDGKEVEFLETDMVIADEEGVLAIAGVKGGKKAEVDVNTKDVIIEVANFDSVAVRKTARRLGIFTDSAKRFENDLTPEVAEFGMLELSGLFVELFPEAKFEEIVDIYPTKEKYQEKRKLVVTQRDVNKVLGVDFDIATITTAVTSLGFSYSETNGIFQIFIPPARLDLTIMEDLVEEIGRVIGYDKVVPIMPKISVSPNINETFAKVFAVREKLLSDGYSEVQTYSFTKKGDVEVARGPKGKSFLRTNISDGIKEAYEMNKLNAGVLGMDEIKIFEIGTVFNSGNEIIHVALADKKGIIEKSLDEFVKENSIDTSSYALPKEKNEASKVFSQWSSFPFITRDVAVLIPNENSNEELEQILNGTKLLSLKPRLVDIYQKDYKTSYAYRLVFQSHEKTLTDEEVAPIMEDLYEKIKAKGWEIR